ncbi:unnamed protein product [Angiostrongylus costaricensis]|uniref:ShKT domain-containing protein n=1 Tax=Angiostrongylus costaricensis TaxID=334426 RepID=A0A0R3PX91_ANGCS|nr:unnamed protein product [Angiostrongylus costaricensis]
MFIVSYFLKILQLNDSSEIISSVLYLTSQSSFSYLAFFFQDCLVTRRECDAFTCSNPQPDSVLNCTALLILIHSCTSRNQKLSSEKCPSICGKCDVKNANLCKDLADSSVCSTLKFCNSVEFYDNTSEQCASTCNRCPVGGQSRVRFPVFLANCTTRKELCTNPSYDGLMHRECAKTCNKCDGCFDASVNCDSWMANGFCTKSDPVTRKRYCARTCKMCPI